MMCITRIFGGLAAIFAVGCSSSGYGDNISSPPPPDPTTVTATSSLTFTPATLTVNAGQAVSFAFQNVAHNVFFTAQAGAPSDVTGSNANTTVTRQFATRGTYQYTCHIHPSMHGTIVVQ